MWNSLVRCWRSVMNWILVCQLFIPPCAELPRTASASWPNNSMPVKRMAG
jgi:hypothetical protein